MRHGVTIYHHEDGGALVTFHDQQDLGLGGGEAGDVSIEDLIDAAHQRISHLGAGLRKNTRKAKAFAEAVEHLEAAQAALEGVEGA